jgi:hypothetical protein
MFKNAFGMDVIFWVMRSMGKNSSRLRLDKQLKFKRRDDQAKRPHSLVGNKT